MIDQVQRIFDAIESQGYPLREFEPVVYIDHAHFAIKTEVGYDGMSVSAIELQDYENSQLGPVEAALGLFDEDRLTEEQNLALSEFYTQALSIRQKFNFPGYFGEGKKENLFFTISQTNRETEAVFSYIATSGRRYELIQELESNRASVHVDAFPIGETTTADGAAKLLKSLAGLLAL